MLNPLNQIESNVARAKRAAIRSKRIIVPANDDLESHRQWVQNHCMAWAEAVESFQHSLESKARVKAFAQRAIGLRTTGLIWRGLSRTRGDNLHREDQRRTRGLGIQLRDRLVVASVGGIALLIAANAVPTISAVPAAPAMTRKPDALRSIVAVPSNLTTDPRKIQGSDQPLGRASGFRVIAGPSVQPLSMSPPTVSVMMTVTNPMALAHAEYDATSATVEGAAPSARPKVRTKLKHKPPKQEPQPLPWLRQQQ